MRRKLILEIKRREKATIRVHNHGYFDFEPGMDGRLYSMRNRSSGSMRGAPAVYTVRKLEER